MSTCMSTTVRYEVQRRGGILVVPLRVEPTRALDSLCPRIHAPQVPVTGPSLGGYGTHCGTRHGACAGYILGSIHFVR